MNYVSRFAHTDTAIGEIDEYRMNGATIINAYEDMSQQHVAVYDTDECVWYVYQFVNGVQSVEKYVSSTPDTVAEEIPPIVQKWLRNGTAHVGMYELNIIFDYADSHRIPYDVEYDDNTYSHVITKLN